jgi:hypothetical protein
MGRAANGGGSGNGDDRAASPGASRATRLLRLRGHNLWAWLTGTGYRPERHYMRGGRPDRASELWPRTV